MKDRKGNLMATPLSLSFPLSSISGQPRDHHHPVVIASLNEKEKKEIAKDHFFSEAVSTFSNFSLPFPPPFSPPVSFATSSSPASLRPIESLRASPQLGHLFFFGFSLLVNIANILFCQTTTENGRRGQCLPSSFPCQHRILFTLLFLGVG